MRVYAGREIGMPVTGIHRCHWNLRYNSLERDASWLDTHRRNFA